MVDHITRASRRSAAVLSGIALARRLIPKNRFIDSRIKHGIAGYVKYRRTPRLGRSPISNPFHFNTAETMALRNLRRAREIMHDPSFQTEYVKLPEEGKKEVLKKYRELIREAAALRIIGKKDRLVHDRTPSVFGKKAFDALVFERLQNPTGKPFSTVMLDLDFFGKVNKKYGQESGNFVLNSFAEALAEFSAKYGGIAGRVGGEEFQLYLPMKPTDAKKAIDAFREQFAKESTQEEFIQGLRLSHPEGSKFFERINRWRKPVQFTAGITGSSRHIRPHTPRELFSLVDHAMQRGKKLGRGRTIFARMRRN